MRITSRRSLVAFALSALIAGLVGSTSPAMAEDPTLTSERPEGVVLLSGTVNAPAGSLTGASIGVFTKGYTCSEDENGNEQCGESWMLQNSGDVDPSTGAYSLYAQANTTVRLLAQGAVIYDNAYGRTPTRESVDVSTGADITTTDADISGLDIDVLAKPSITGTISLSEQALQPPLPGDYEWSPITVRAYLHVSKGSYSKWLLADSVDIPASALAVSVAYRVPVKLSGTYRVSVSGYWIHETFYGGDSLETATDINVDETDATGIDLAPALLPTLSGTLTPPQGTDIPKGLMVAAIPFDANGQPVDQGDSINLFRFAFAAEDGSYKIPVPAGTYVLLALGNTMYGFYGEEPECFRTQGFDKGCFPQTFTIGADGGTGYDMQLRLFPVIRGTVTLPEGVSGASISVAAERWQPGEPDCFDNFCGEWAQDFSTFGTVTDNGDGTASYVIPISQPGTYRVVFTGSEIERTTIGSVDESYGDRGPNDDAALFTSLTEPDVVRDVTLTPQLFITVDFDASALFAAGFDSGAKVMCNDADDNQVVDESIDMSTLPAKVPVTSGTYTCWLYVYLPDAEGPLDASVIDLGSPTMDSDGYFDVTSTRSATLSLKGMGPIINGTARVSEVGDGSVTVTWDTSVAYDGGAPVEGYHVRAWDRSALADSDVLCETDADGRSCTITGLENLREYSFHVFAFNSFGESSDPAYTDEVVPHDDRFQICVPQGNVARNANAKIWVLGAQGYEVVTVKVGNESFEVTPGENGDGYFYYLAEESNPSVVAGKMKITARASRINDSGRKERVAARATLYIPKFSLKASWKQGSSVVARVTSMQPGSTVYANIVGENYSGDVVCTAEASASGRATCTFDAPPPGDYMLTMRSGSESDGFDIGSRNFTVKPARRS
ncbi:MAG: fibronectin type III domain-containing protein [Actinobacteria bacterium]|nr:fibronectin type III domain-containing protein [Actinomycetota bacterium]